MPVIEGSAVIQQCFTTTTALPLMTGIMFSSYTLGNLMASCITFREKEYHFKE